MKCYRIERAFQHRNSKNVKFFHSMKSYSNTLILPPWEDHWAHSKYFLHRRSCLGSDAHSNHGSSGAFQQVTCGMTCTVPLVCTVKLKKKKEESEKSLSLKFLLSKSTCKIQIHSCVHLSFTYFIRITFFRMSENPHKNIS